MLLPSATYLLLLQLINPGAQLVLTHIEPRNNFLSARDQVPLAESGPPSIVSILSYKGLSPQQSEVDDLIQLCSGQGQEPH
jgi:hypothetical protein